MGGGGALTPTSTPSSPSSSSEPLPPEFAEHVAVSPISDDDGSDECCVCDDDEVEATRYYNRQLREAKELIRRYKPGDWVEGVGGTKAGHFLLPEITTLLLVGPRGSGKSTLVNQITRVFDKDDDPFAPDRAQVSCNSKSNGTIFLREYPIPRNSSGICVYDTCGWSNDPENNFKMLHQWMTKGISHGETTMWDNDEGNKTGDIKPLGRQYSFLRYITRKVNFVIFVVDGAAVLESIDSNNKGYTEILHQTFMYPFLSIGDDKPVVVVTHGDRLSIQQRAHVQNELAELLNIPAQQIYDIPGSDDYQTDMAVLDMLHYCVRHAEQNLPVKLNYHLEV
ncbi:unnamed protein product [Miscanthus lutarioriparius]|uniref:G domain-containing protein n=1 Tax=Miscanthus lutarioriparius TaxID=422564 RepID=A0A811PSK5_9POAL|nr:unnamed protein product [Miscanthus lutarioriparius]